MDFRFLDEQMNSEVDRGGLSAGEYPDLSGQQPQKDEEPLLLLYFHSSVSASPHSLSCFPSLCFFTPCFCSSPLSYSLLCCSLQTFLRPWVRWEKNRPHSPRKPKRFLVWVAEADEKHSWKCETFRWDLRLGIFKCFQCSAQTLELLWRLSYCQRLLAQSPSSLRKVNRLTILNGLLYKTSSYDEHCCNRCKPNDVFHVSQGKRKLLLGKEKKKKKWR